MGRCRTTNVITVAVSSAILALLAATPDAIAQDKNIDRGAAIITAKCARCHATGRNDASTLPNAPPFRTLARKYPLHFLAESLAEGIVTGHNDMPAFVFDPDEIDAILSYIGSISDR